MVFHCDCLEFSSLLCIWISFRLWFPTLVWLLCFQYGHCEISELLQNHFIWLTHLLNLTEERICSGAKSLTACDRWRHLIETSFSKRMLHVGKTGGMKKVVICSLWMSQKGSANLCLGLWRKTSDCKSSAASPHTSRTHGERQSGPTCWTGTTSLKVWAAEAC